MPTDDKYLHKKVTEIPLYKGKLLIIFSNCADKVKAVYPDFEDPDVYAHAIYTHVKGWDSFIVLLNFDNKLSRISPGVIAHEAVHTANSIARERGVQSDFLNDEPIAYLAEWITDEVYKFMAKHGFKAS